MANLLPDLLKKGNTYSDFKGIGDKSMIGESPGFRNIYSDFLDPGNRERVISTLEQSDRLTRGIVDDISNERISLNTSQFCNPGAGKVTDCGSVENDTVKRSGRIVSCEDYPFCACDLE